MLCHIYSLQLLNSLCQYQDIVKVFYATLEYFNIRI